MQLLKVTLILILLFGQSAFAERNTTRLLALTNICETAMRTGDLGTVKSIARQLIDQKLPDDDILISKIQKCLNSAYGDRDQGNVKTQTNNLIAAIRSHDQALKVLCNKLLDQEPRAAIAIDTCRKYLMD